jgi:hypothetical protein
MFQNISSWPPAEQLHSYNIGVNWDPVRRFSLIVIIFLLFIYELEIQFQVLDSFISTITSFKSDSDSISAHTQSVDSTNDSMAGHGARSSRTRAGKRKATNTPPQKKKPQKEVWNRSTGIKIEEPTSNPSLAPTPLESTSERYYFR